MHYKETQAHFAAEKQFRDKWAGDSSVNVISEFHVTNWKGKNARGMIDKVALGFWKWGSNQRIWLVAYRIDPLELAAACIALDNDPKHQLPKTYR